MAVAGLVSSMPWLVTLSQHKNWVFAGSGSMIALTLFLVYGLGGGGQDSERCDVGNGAACAVTGQFTRIALWIAVTVYLIGLFLAYLYLPLKLYIDSL